MPEDTPPQIPPELIPAEIAKREAEARKAEAEARKADAEALVAQVAAARVSAETELHAHIIGVDLANAQLGRLRELALDEYHRVYRFSSGVDGGSGSKCVAKLQEWVRLDENAAEKKSIEIEFFSPGGEVTAGLALFDFIQTVRRAGHHVTTSTRGMAASMAGILLQAGDERVMAKESWLLIHQVQAGMMGSWGELMDRAKWLERIQDRILDIFAERAAAVEDSKFTTAKAAKAFLKKNWERTDWWIDSDEALKLGLVDSVR